jgi:hypothetical protein
MILITEKICGDKIIPNRIVTSFEKINDEPDSFILNEESLANPSLFRLELMIVSNKTLYVYGVGSIKDSVCFFILDSNNDRNFRNDDMLEIPINKSIAKPCMLKCKYPGGTTWV